MPNILENTKQFFSLEISTDLDANVMQIVFGQLTHAVESRGNEQVVLPSFKDFSIQVYSS